MPEETEIAPAPEAALEPLSMESMMGRFESATTPETKPEIKPEPEAAKPSAAKPEPETKLETKPAATPAKPAPKEAPKEDAGSLRRRLQEVSTSESTLKKEIEKVRKENQELSVKRLTPEIEKEIEQNRQHIAAMRQQISEVAYERSDDFKRQFKEPWDNGLKSAIAAAQQFPIVNDEGETRVATPADFWKVAGASLTERAQIARQLFGDNAINVLSDIRDLERLKTQADQAVKNHREGFEGREKQQREQQEARQKSYSGLRENYRKELVEKYPSDFGDDPNDPEATAAMKKGLDFVDGVATGTADGKLMTDNEHAAYSEVLRFQAAWFWRGRHANKVLAEKNAALEAELEKLRGGDPGGEEHLDARGEKPKRDDEVGDIESMAARLEQKARLS